MDHLLEISVLARLADMDRNLEKMTARMRSSATLITIAAQSDLLRDNMEGFLSRQPALAETSVDAAEEAGRRLTETTEKQRRAA